MQFPKFWSLRVGSRQPRCPYKCYFLDVKWNHRAGLKGTNIKWSFLFPHAKILSPKIYIQLFDSKLLRVSSLKTSLLTKDELIILICSKASVRLSSISESSKEKRSPARERSFCPKTSLNSWCMMSSLIINGLSAGPGHIFQSSEVSKTKICSRKYTL